MTMDDILGFNSFEGPAYADRVGGRLTFRDWEHWAPEDQAEYRAEYETRRPGKRLGVFLCWEGKDIFIKLFAVGPLLCGVTYSDYHQGFEPA